MEAWPDDVHVAVLRFLGGPGQVQGYLWPYSSLCRTCAESALLPPLWRHIDLSDGPVCGGGGGGGGGLLDLLRRSGRNVERLVLCGRAEVDDAFVEGLAELLAGGPLRSLDLGGCPRLKGATLRHLHKAPLLEELSVECLASLDDQLLAEVCGCCPRLHSLSVRFCEGLTDAAALLERPGGWRALQFDGCFRLDVTSLLAEPHGAWQRLEDLSLDGEDLEAQQLALIAPSFPRLRCLVISFARELDSGVLAGLSALPFLESLTLRKASQPTDADWASFFTQQRATRLRSGRADAPSTVEWQILNVAECELFSDAAATSFAAAGLPALVDVDLSWCWHLSDAGLGALLAAAPSLQRVRLAGMKGLTAGGLAPCCAMPRLEELDCTSCNGVADSMLEFLHRLFTAPPGSCGEALPGEPLPPHVARAARGLWKQRSRALERVRIKNYYAEYLEEWAQLRPPREVCKHAEEVLASCSHFNLMLGVRPSGS